MFMNLKDFDFELPERLIAQEPRERGKSKMLVLKKESGEIEHRKISDILDYFQAGDILVRNATRVIPARLFGVKTTGVKTEVLLNRPIKYSEKNFSSKFKNHLYYEVILEPGRRYQGKGERIIF
jgi:S-adenosylmethionine:tRNA-ribosyltransferase-isomerase (queuine synthetase)